MKDYQAVHFNHSSVGNAASWGDPLQAVISVSRYCYPLYKKANSCQMCRKTEWQEYEFMAITDEACTLVSTSPIEWVRVDIDTEKDSRKALSEVLEEIFDVCVGRKEMKQFLNITDFLKVPWNERGRLSSFSILDDIAECSFYVVDESCSARWGLKVFKPEADLRTFNGGTQSFWCQIIAR